MNRADVHMVQSQVTETLEDVAAVRRSIVSARSEHIMTLAILDRAVNVLQKAESALDRAKQNLAAELSKPRKRGGK